MSKFKFHERVKHDLHGVGYVLANIGDMVFCRFKKNDFIVYSKNLIRKVR